MIDIKKYEELVSKSAEKKADSKILVTMGSFIKVNMETCRLERNYQELDAWTRALNDVNMKLKKINDEMEGIAEQLDRMVKKIEV